MEEIKEELDFSDFKPSIEVEPGSSIGLQSNKQSVNEFVEDDPEFPNNRHKYLYISIIVFFGAAIYIMLKLFYFTSETPPLDNAEIQAIPLPSGLALPSGVISK